MNITVVYQTNAHKAYKIAANTFAELAKSPRVAKPHCGSDDRLSHHSVPFLLRVLYDADKQRGCFVKAAQEKKKATAFYRKVSSCRLLYYII